MSSKRILVTGGAGFIGANLIRHLLKHTDWTIVSLDRLDPAGSLERLAELRHGHIERLKCIWADLRAPLNPAHHGELLREPFDYVAHLAAMSHVERSIASPTDAVMDNVLGTANLLDYVRWFQPRAKVLYFSTDEVFGPAPEGLEYDEHARHEPNNPYAAAKSGGEQLCPAYAHQYGLRIVVSRCMNAYGPGQYREKYIPSCIEKIARGELVQVHARDGIPSSRHYIHVDDVSRAVVVLLERGGVIADDKSGRYNIGGTREVSNLDVAVEIAALLGRQLHFELVTDPPGRPKPDMRYGLSCEKLFALGWRPEVEFLDGLRTLVLNGRKAA